MMCTSPNTDVNKKEYGIYFRAYLKLDNSGSHYKLHIQVDDLPDMLVEGSNLLIVGTTTSGKKNIFFKNTFLGCSSWGRQQMGKREGYRHETGR